MNRFKFTLSLILMPALANMAMGQTTCTSGGGGSTLPVLTLPAVVTGFQQSSTANGTDFSFTISGLDPAGNYSISNTTYGAWCTNPNGNVVNTTVQYTPYNTYAYSSYTAGADTGFPGPVYLSTTGQTLTLSQEWNAVNWVLNNKMGQSGALATTVVDIQAVIWQLLHPTDGYGYVSSNQGPSGPTTAALTLYNNAVQFGTGFIPSNGQFTGVVMVPVSPTYAGDQGVLVPVPVVGGGGCTGTSTVSLTKTSNVAVANAYQLVTYTYVVKNTGTNVLSNVVVTDDNGTPGYAADDYTVGTIASLASGASATLTSTVYLPVTYVYVDAANNVNMDTMIVQIPAATPTLYKMTYLQDADVIDNAYGTSAGAYGWSAVGGHSFTDLTNSAAEFALFDTAGNAVEIFTENYLKGGQGTASGYNATLNEIDLGNPANIGGFSSTLAYNLNSFGKFKTATVNSVNADTDWQNIAGYQFTINKAAFGFYSLGSICVQNVWNAKTKFKAGSSYYSPKIMTSTVKSTATVSAYVACCKIYINAMASVTVKVNGCPVPCVPQMAQHKCGHQYQCACTCSYCSLGKHGQCSQTSCKDVKCHDSGCAQQCQCKCSSCLSGYHGNCTDSKCTDVKCKVPVSCPTPVPSCACSCPRCSVGDHSHCMLVKGCSDNECRKAGCTNYCHCTCYFCSTGNHSWCAKFGCKDVTCHQNGCKK